MIMASLRPIRLAAAALLALSLAACGSDAPTRDDASRDASSSAVRQASASAASRFDEIVTALAKRSPALRPIATSTSDTCHAGVTNGSFPHDPYRLTCSRGETRYFGAWGELLDALRQMDAGAKQAGLMTVSGESLDDVEAYFAAYGNTGDGLTQPHPRLTYVAQGYDGPLHVGWSQASDSRPSHSLVERRWPMVFQDDHPVDENTLWNGPLRGQKYLIRVTSAVTYHEVPWES